MLLRTYQKSEEAAHRTGETVCKVIYLVRVLHLEPMKNTLNSEKITQIKKMGKGSEQAHFHRRYTAGPQAHGKMLRLGHHQGNGNPSHSEMLFLLTRML